MGDRGLHSGGVAGQRGDHLLGIGEPGVQFGELGVIRRGDILDCGDALPQLGKIGDQSHHVGARRRGVNRVRQRRHQGSCRHARQKNPGGNFR
jgi:hypothetical protein